MKNRLVDIVSKRDDKAEFSDLLKRQILALPSEDIHKLDKLVEYGLAMENEILTEYKQFKENKLKYMMFFWNKILINKWLLYNFKN